METSTTVAAPTTTETTSLGPSLPPLTEPPEVEPFELTTSSQTVSGPSSDWIFAVTGLAILGSIVLGIMVGVTLRLLRGYRRRYADLRASDELY